MKSGLILVQMLLLACTLGPSATAVSYQATNIGQFPCGWEWTHMEMVAIDMNKSGQVLFSFYDYGGQAVYSAYLWDRSNGFQDISGDKFIARGLDDSGVVTGTRGEYHQGDGWTGYYTYAATRSPATGLLTDLSMPAGAVQTDVRSVNAAGEVAGSASFADSDSPVLWHSDGTPEVLDSSPGFSVWNISISDCGNVAWDSSKCAENEDGSWTTTYRSCRWDRHHGVVELPGLREGDATSIIAVNDLGWILGTSYNGSVDGRRYVLWKSDNSITDLGPYYPTDASYNSLNDAGQLAGQLDGRAVIWNPDGSITDLGTLAGSYSTGCAIDDDGRVIGWADLGGNPYLTLWTPVPEPSSALALMAALAGFLPFLRRQRQS